MPNDADASRVSTTPGHDRIADCNKVSEKHSEEGGTFADRFIVTIRSSAGGAIRRSMIWATVADGIGRSSDSVAGAVAGARIYIIAICGTHQKLGACID